MPKFAPVELTVLDVDNSWKAAVEGDEGGGGGMDGGGEEEEGEDAGEEQGEEVGKLSEEEQAEEAKREGVRTQWIDTLQKAGPAFVKGLPLKLNVTDPVFDRIFATKSTFFLSHGGPVSQVRSDTLKGGTGDGFQNGRDSFFMAAYCFLFSSLVFFDNVATALYQLG